MSKPLEYSVEPISASERIHSVLSPEYSELLAMLCSTPAFGADGSFDLAGLRQGMATRREPQGPEIHIKPTDASGIPAQWVYLDSDTNNDRFMYLHGGGYVSGSGDFYLPMAAQLARATRCAVLLPDYRLAPEHPHPAAVDDAVAAFNWMRGHGPEYSGTARTTYIGGDSAGGGLTLATLLALRDVPAQPVLPDAAVTISAYADLAHTGYSLKAREAGDPIMSPLCLPHFAAAYLAGADPRTPLASPLYADFHGLPPLLMQVGDREIIRDDTVRAARRMQQCGVDVTLEVWDDMIHVWHSHVPLVPEARAAIEHIAVFLERVKNGG